jgi:dTMP kinase
MFLAVEGIEGSGKSTFSKSLGARIEKELGVEVILTREPGSTQLGIELRKLLLQQDLYKTNQTAELLLFAADRAQHIFEVIQPALEKNKFVITDRFIHSTIAYQGSGRGIDLATIEATIEIATQGILPDIVILLDLDVETGLARASSRGADSWTSFEREELDFHQRIRAGFLDLAKKDPSRFLVLDATKSPEALVELALTELKKRYV